MTKPITEKDQQWLDKQYSVANRYLATKGLEVRQVIDKESHYYTPLFAIGKCRLSDDSLIWLICGEVPIDHSNASVALTPREAIRHFASKWQLQAEHLSASSGDKQNEFAGLLVARAEQLMTFYQNDTLW